MSETLSQAVLEELTVAPLTGVSGQGKPVYGLPVAIRGRVVPEDAVVRTGRGEEIRSIATVWIAPGQDALPESNDRLVLASGLTGIVIERKEGRTLGNVLDHVRVRIRQE